MTLHENSVYGTVRIVQGQREHDHGQRYQHRTAHTAYTTNTTLFGFQIQH